MLRGLFTIQGAKTFQKFTSEGSTFNIFLCRESIRNYSDSLDANGNPIPSDLKDSSTSPVKPAPSTPHTASLSSPPPKNHLPKVPKNIPSPRDKELSPPLHDHFDLIVLGSGPAAQKCAIDAAKRLKKVALVDKSKDLGGVCVHTGTIPSKTFREAILHLTGYRHQGFYGKSYQPVKKFSVEDILYRVALVVERETNVIRDQLRRNGISIIDGMARFVDEKRIVVNMKTYSESSSKSDSDPKFVGEREVTYTADHFMIAVGTRPAQRPDFPFDGKTIFDSDQILQTDWSIPRDLIVVGAGVIGMEYASMINVIPGSRVIVVDERPSILPFADREVIDTLCYNMRQQGARFLLNEKIKSVKVEVIREVKKVCALLESGKKLYAQALLYAVGRQGNTDSLDLDKVGIKPNKRGLLTVNENFQTQIPHIYAAGDCVGFPALASTSMEQGRLASCHMWGATQIHKPEFFPYGIYTIPEVSMVGKSEEQLTEEKIAYEVGISRYEELAKGQMLGGGLGFLKILFCPDSLKLLGVHCIGEGATEIIHIGQTILSLGGTVDYFRESVFNYPTLAEAYRVAALNGLQKVHK